MAYSSLEQQLVNNYLDVNYPQPEPEPEQSMDGVQLAAGPSPVVSDAGAAFGVYPGMGKRSQRSDIGERMVTGAPDFAAGMGRGGVTAALGFGGDVQNMFRFISALATDNQGGSIMDKFGRAAKTMEEPTFLPTSKEVSEKGFTIPGTQFTIPMPPAVPPGTSAFGMTPEQRQAAAEAGQFAGELVGDPVALAKGGKAAVSLVKKLPKNVPVGASVKPVGEIPTGAPTAPTSDIGFYSAVEQAALRIQRKQGTGQAMLNDILKGENVKQDEVKWIGLDDFLKGKKNVTREEVQQFIAANKVDIKEVTLDSSKTVEREKLKEASHQALQRVDEMIPGLSSLNRANLTTFWAPSAQAGNASDLANIRALNLSEDQMQAVMEYGAAVNRQRDFIESSNGYMAQPKFGQYTLPGGENYREILLTMPSRSEREIADANMQAFTDRVTKRIGRTGWDFDLMTPDELAEYERLNQNAMKASTETLKGYKSSHWDEPNVLAHIRVNDRVDADGKKMLLVEEVQSDWHQAGRDKGYKSDVNPEENKALVKQWDTLANERRDLERIVAVGDDADPAVQSAVQRLGEISNELNAVNDRLTQVRTTFREGVPDAPMKDTWYQLALKRVLKYAADNGYERVGLTTGARQAERYDLSKQISKVYYSPPDSKQANKFGTVLKAFDKRGHEVINKSVTPDQLPDYIGKEVAKKLLESEGNSMGVKTLDGVDLSVGGEGMKKYYDEVYPQFLAKYGKKWDAKMGETKINLQGDLEGFMPRKDMQVEPVRYIDITPQMRESVSKGQPLFTATGLGTGTGAATMQDKEKK